MRDTLTLTRLRFLPKRTTIAERVEEMYTARHDGLHCQTTIITRQGNRTMSCTVIRAITCQDFVSSRIKTRDLDSILICFRATKREESLLQITRCNFRELLAKQSGCLGGITWMGKRQLRCLILNGFDNFGVLMPDICIHQLR